MYDAEGSAETLVHYEAKIAAQERKVGQLTMELDPKKRPGLMSAAARHDRLSAVQGQLCHSSELSNDWAGAQNLLLPVNSLAC